MKIKCVKFPCQVCSKSASIQVFYNNSGVAKYARARHYTGQLDGKPQFEYHQQNIEALKTLLKTQGISLNTEKASSGQIGQTQTIKQHDLDKPKDSLFQQSRGGCRLVWFRTLAFQANDPGFKSRRPHQFFTLSRCIRNLHVI
jgi:hypothetical protein